MDRRICLCAVLLAIAWGPLCARVHAQETDGPGPVNTEASLTAGADDNVGGDNRSQPSAARARSRVSSVSVGDGHAAGVYMGVSPGGAQPPAVPVAPGSSPVVITWPGFQMRPDGTSRVFFQSTSPVSPQTESAPNKFIVTLPGVKVAGHNNKLPLETRFFDTPVTRVTIVPSKSGVVITLELRAPVTPVVSTERGQSGYSFTYLDLPAGNYLSASEKAQVAPQPPQSSGVPKPSPNTDPKYLPDDAHGSTRANVQVDTSMDGELPPSVKASGGLKLHN